MNNVKTARKFVWALIVTSTICSNGFALDSAPAASSYWNSITSAVSSGWKSAQPAKAAVLKFASEKPEVAFPAVIAATAVATAYLFSKEAQQVINAPFIWAANTAKAAGSLLRKRWKVALPVTLAAAALGAAAYTGHLQTAYGYASDFASTLFADNAETVTEVVAPTVS